MHPLQGHDCGWVGPGERGPGPRRVRPQGAGAGYRPARPVPRSRRRLSGVRGRCPGQASPPRRPAAGPRVADARPGPRWRQVDGPSARRRPSAGSRVSVPSGLCGGDLGRLQRRRHHQQPMSLPCHLGLCRPQRGGLARRGRALHDHQLAVTSQGADHGGLGGVDSRQAPTVQPDPSGRLPGAAGEAVNEVRLDLQHLLGGQRTAMSGDVG